MNTRRRIVMLGLSLLMVAMALALISCVDTAVGVQGRLTDNTGNPVADGNYDVTFGFWTAGTGGTEVFSQTLEVAVSDGLFSTTVTDFPPHIFSAEVDPAVGRLYMEITVEGETLSPRRPVNGAPFAHGLVAGSGVVGARPATATDGGFNAALMVVNTNATSPGYGIRAQSGNAALYADNVRGNGALGQSTNAEDNPDIILGGYYLSSADGALSLDNYRPGVIATDPASALSSMFLRSNDELYLYKAYDGGTSQFRIYDGGNTDVQARLDSTGDWSIDGSYSSGGADVAELIDVEGAEAEYEPGDVLVISDELDRAVELAAEAYSSRVIGVYSAQPGFVAGAGTPEEQIALEEQALAAAGVEGEEGVAAALMEIDDGAIEVAIAGIVSVKVSAENGPIQRGDLLTTSNTPGHAMKATEFIPGTILGKAMGTLDSGTGVIEVLVMLQ